MQSELFGYSIINRPKKLFLENLERQLLAEGQMPQGANLITIACPNAEQMVQAQENPSFASSLKQFSILIPDGTSVVLASRLLAIMGKMVPIAERIAGVDLVSDLLIFAKKNQLKTLLIGGRNYGKSPLIFSINNQEISVEWVEGYSDKQKPTPEEEKHILDQISAVKPDLVFVALGAPEQEQWIVEHLKELSQAKTRLAMAVGGSFDMLLGILPRAPEWMQQFGLEWLFRLSIEPTRFKRQLRLFTFWKMAIAELFAKK